MRLRRAAPADRAPIWAVRTRAIRHGAASHYDADAIAAWTGRLTPAKCGERLLTRAMFVAEDDDGRIAGYAQLDPADGVVEAVYVDPDFARQGIGRALLAALEDEARRLGIDRLVLESSLNAVPFYAAQGYGKDADLASGDGRAIACTLMSKRLDAPLPRAA